MARQQGTRLVSKSFDERVEIVLGERLRQLLRIGPRNKHLPWRVPNPNSRMLSHKHLDLAISAVYVVLCWNTGLLMWSWQLEEGIVRSKPLAHEYKPLKHKREAGGDLHPT